MKRFFSILSTISLLSGATATARAVEFDSDLSGNYRGNWTVTSGVVLTTSVTGKVAVPPSGNRLRLQINGRIKAGMQTVPINTTISFGPGRRVRANSSLLGFLGPSGTLPSGFRGSNNLSTTLRARPGTTLMTSDITGTTMKYSFKFSPRRVQIVGRGSLVIGGTPQSYVVRSTLNRRGR